MKQNMSRNLQRVECHRWSGGKWFSEAKFDSQISIPLGWFDLKSTPEKCSLLLLSAWNWYAAPRHPLVHAPRPGNASLPGLPLLGKCPQSQSHSADWKRHISMLESGEYQIYVFIVIVSYWVLSKALLIRKWVRNGPHLLGLQEELVENKLSHREAEIRR